MKLKLIIILTFVSIIAKGQYSWEFTAKLYMIDNTGNVDSVLFGNDSSATIGIDPLLGEQNIFGSTWDSLEIRSIHRMSDSIDCPINNANLGYIFNSDLDLKIDMRKSQIYLDTSTFFVFKMNAIHYPVDIYSDFTDMYNNSMYNNFSWILKHQHQCLYNYPASCLPNYQYLFTIPDSTENYITVKLDFEVGVDEPKGHDKLFTINNPIHNILNLNYAGRYQVYDIKGILLMDHLSDRKNTIDISNLKPGVYLLKTKFGISKIIKI